MANAQGLHFTGNSLPEIVVDVPATTGLENVYVVNNVQGVTVSFPIADSNAQVYTFGNAGGGYVEPCGNTWMTDGNVNFTAPDKDSGIIIDESGRRHCFWIVDYSHHESVINGLFVDIEASDCSRTALRVDGSISPIIYYTVNGRPTTLSRELKIEYSTLVYDENDAQWVRQNQIYEEAGTDALLHVEAPLCNTEFQITGDRFQEKWGNIQHAASSLFSTYSVEAHTEVTQNLRDADNEKRPDASSLGGSAPCEITFTAQSTDAAVFHEWQFSRTEMFEDVFDRYTEETFTNVFTETGTTYARYVAADADARCYYESPVYVISIGESKLECPNAFSPGNRDGVNDEWKVSYSSIVSFHCEIFNRWGNRIATLTSPDQGWDGRYDGKDVPSGVYFYVIKARGADGVNYNKSGDINILNSRRNNSSSSGTLE